MTPTGEDNPRTEGDDTCNSISSRDEDMGFILLESLIALAMVSVLSLSAMSVIRTVSRVYRNPGAKKLAPITASLAADPNFYRTHGQVQLKSVRSLGKGATWRVYVYEPNPGNQIVIPIYDPPDKQ